jgi:hypothetical protein
MLIVVYSTQWDDLPIARLPASKRDRIVTLVDRLNDKYKDVCEFIIKEEK